MSTHVLAAVLTRLKLLTGAQTDAELSRALSVSPQTLSSWKVRDSVPYSLCIEIARQHGCSLDWLLLGEGEQCPVCQSEPGWEFDMLDRLRTLSPVDRHAILLHIKDKQRIQQLEQQLNELTSHLPEASSG
ncbi:TPA: helix-turn-helix domain-containing protein [Pseudomonas putida]|uniref:helix-turn-helix domain-containing protein n=1 Tax=Pseudomonas putida TaxID=303 RepID=UPI00110C9EDD|nr:helix-turn-helix domain-containing protein [Pseudomonas putida]MDD1995413.1 helix-turn-helix domain containing protein [Pseudomonas putida]HDS0920405.1 helix-turn-helix domain-containing protein [Pseudomonas putida]HDS0935616.1 helix-turn-helix domain-containing protein [Pseudomonas putida]HDS1783991.1 helix-turn-helix domain-containing protein [Pseudomonas putida]HDS3799793.1 helix-turn-helix domain-containing protein [Pseudomonas putida]